jgi:hypothetical protein
LPWDDSDGDCGASSKRPVNVVTGLDPFNTGFLEGAFGIARPNLVLGVPLYLESGAPGGKIIKETWDAMH